MKEMIGTILAGLIALLGLGWVGQQVYAGMQNTKISNTVADIQTLTGNIQAMYSSTGSYATLTNTVVLNSKDVAPAEMLVGGALQNQWGNGITITSGTVLAGYTAQQIAIATGVLPQGACVKVLSSLKVIAAKVGAAAIQVGPIDPGTIAADCATGAGAVSITMIMN